MVPELIQKIRESALTLLAEDGLHVANHELTQRLRQLGFTVSGQRVLIAKNQAEGYLEWWKGWKHSQTASTVEKENVVGTTNEYCSHLLRSGGRSPVLFDFSSLVEATDQAEYICTLYGQHAGMVGQPSDTPAVLQSLMRCIAAMYCTQADYPFEPCSVVSAKYLFELAALCKQTIRKLNIYMATPMSFGGESVDIALQFADRVEQFKVTSMPALGCNAPITLASALSLGLAENLGGAVLLSSLTNKPCDFLVQLHPFDFKAMNFVYGTPETQILSEIANDFNASLLNQKCRISRANIHVMAKEPGVQAAAEKSAMITAGIKNGATVFNGIGALSLDEIYSPVQLVMDLEMLKQGARLRDHWQCDEPNDTDSILEQIRFGLKDGYISADETLDSFAQCVWNSRLFTRYSLAEYSRRGEKEALKKAHDLAESFAGQPPVYRPNSHTRKELISICKAAYREVTGSCWYPEIMAKD